MMLHGLRNVSGKNNLYDVNLPIEQVPKSFQTLACLGA